LYPLPFFAVFYLGVQISLILFFSGWHSFLLIFFIKSLVLVHVRARVDRTSVQITDYVH
jgi:hypothetical protein